MRPDNITLIGFMGTGKSSVAKALKSFYPDYKVADCDSLVVDRSGKSIADIFQDEGEDVFRGLETAAIEESLSQTKKIVATGGGAILRDENRAFIHSHSWVVWLVASPETIYDRIKEEKHRPLINTGSSAESIIIHIRMMLHKRFELYREITDVMINTDSLSPIEVANAIQEELERLKKCSASA